MWIQPLELKIWLISVFAGSNQVFTGVALFVIASMAGYFRMTGTTALFLIVMFFLMFSSYIDQSIYFVIISLGGLLAGFLFSQLVKR